MYPSRAGLPFRVIDDRKSIKARALFYFDEVDDYNRQIFVPAEFHSFILEPEWRQISGDLRQLTDATRVVFQHYECLTVNTTDSSGRETSVEKNPSIPPRCLMNFENLKEITLPDGNGRGIVIENNAFEGCKTLKFMWLPSMVEIIEKRAFRGCTALESVTFPPNPVSIGSFAFKNCIALKEVECMPKIIKQLAFEECTNMVSFTCRDLPDPSELLDDGRILRYGAFSECTSLQRFVFPLGITVIPSHAFTSCVSLRSVIVPEGVVEIGLSAYANCTQLMSVTFPSTLRVIGPNAFLNCESLRTVAPIASEIGEGCFRHCLSLESVSLSGFSGNTLAQSIFVDCENLIAVRIPDSVVTIRQYAFANCKSLVVVEFNESESRLEGIFSYAFVDCTALPGINLPQNIRSISFSAFQNCTDITKIMLPASLDSIGLGAFRNCNKLAAMYFQGTRPLTRLMGENSQGFVGSKNPPGYPYVTSVSVVFCDSRVLHNSIAKGTEVEVDLGAGDLTVRDAWSTNVRPLGIDFYDEQFFTKMKFIHDIDKVAEGSVAEAAGIKRGDAIVSINGARFTGNNYELARYLETLTGTVRLGIARNRDVEFCQTNFKDIELDNLGIYVSGTERTQSFLFSKMKDANAFTREDIRAEKELILSPMRFANVNVRGMMQGISMGMMLYDPERVFRAKQSAVPAQFGQPFKDYVSLAMAWPKKL